MLHYRVQQVPANVVVIKHRELGTFHNQKWLHSSYLWGHSGSNRMVLQTNGKKSGDQVAHGIWY